MYIRAALRSIRCKVLCYGLVAVTVYIVIAVFKSAPTLRQEKEYPALEWFRAPTVACGGNWTGFGNEMVVLKNARILNTSAFAVPCTGEIPKYHFRYSEEGPLDEWLANLIRVDSHLSKQLRRQLTPTFVIQRIEAFNLYHTLCEWFNVYMVSKLLHLDASKVDIVFLDHRPKSPLDETWQVLFGTVYFVDKIDFNIVYNTLIWNIIGSNSPLNFHNLQSVPFLEEFRAYFLTSFGLQSKSAFDCNRLNVTIILRRDYMTLLERKENFNGGPVHRKIQNEEDMVTSVQKVFTAARVATVFLERLTMAEQLGVITQTDVLLGMHGAGMTHVLFLPKHAVTIEFFPSYWGVLRNFKTIANWRGMKYFGWKNKDEHNEYEDFYTRIPPEIVEKYSTAAYRHLCKSS